MAKNTNEGEKVELNKELINQGVELGLGTFDVLAKLSEADLSEKITNKLDAMALEDADNEEKEQAKSEVEEVKKAGAAKIKEVAKEKPDVAKLADEFDEDKYIEFVEYSDEGETKVKEKIKAKFAAQKGKVRAARAYNVSIEHLTVAYKALNGKKIDGFYATDLIDRYGFSSLQQAKNRADIAAKYGKTSSFTVDIAEEKLKLIIKYENVVAAYGAYMKDIKAELDRGLDEANLFGE